MNEIKIYKIKLNHGEIAIPSESAKKAFWETFNTMRLK